MARHTAEEEDEEFADDPEGPDEADRDRDDADPSSETVQCPWCRADVYEGAERCPHCGKYLSDEDAPSRKPLWVIAGVVGGVVAILVTWLLCHE